MRPTDALQPSSSKQAEDQARVGAAEAEAVAARARAIASHLRIDARAPRLRVRQLFEHQHAGAARRHESVARGVVGPRGCLGAIVEGGNAVINIRSVYKKENVE